MATCSVDKVNRKRTNNRFAMPGLAISSIWAYIWPLIHLPQEQVEPCGQGWRRERVIRASSSPSVKVCNCDPKGENSFVQPRTRESEIAETWLSTLEAHL